MAVHENRKGEVITTLSAIRAWTSLSTRAIQYGLEDLQQAGFISVLTPFQRTANSSAKFALTSRDASGASVVTHQVRQVVSENAQSDTGRLNAEAVAELSELSPPYMERTSGDPFGVPSLRVQGSMSYPEVQENEELGQEGISITRDGQAELIPTDTPAWLTNLRTTPSYDLDAAHEQRLIQRVGNTAISTQRLCETSAAIAAKWESVRWSPSNKRGYKRIDLTFYAWANRKEVDRGTSQNRGLDSDVIPDRLEAYRRSYGRYMKVTP